MSKEHMICSAEEARLLWRTSWTCAPAAAIQYFYYSNADIAAISLLVLMSSLVYWHKPTYGWRRNTDMICVFIGITHNMYCASSATNPNSYYFFTALGVNIYGIGWYYYKRGELHKSIYMHSLVHICANIANTCLASSQLNHTPIV